LNGGNFTVQNDDGGRVLVGQSDHHRFERPRSIGADMAVEAKKKLRLFERPRRAWRAISGRTALEQNNSLLYPPQNTISLYFL
jgi:hypothetical protein